MSKRILTGLAVFAALVLGGAAVWMGGLNQDEGWYLYAANLVAEGQVPYADFAFTQGPVMPAVYSVFSGIWQRWGILGARVFTLALGFAGILFAALTARRIVGADEKSASTGTRWLAAPTVAALLVFLLLGNNLYHLYYLAIPKTYALASLFVSVAFYLLTFLRDGRAGVRIACAVLAGASLALAAGTRISLGAILAVVGVGLAVSAFSPAATSSKSPYREGGSRWLFLWFGLGGGVVLALVYGSLLLCPATREGLLAAQKYHAARGGFDIVFAVGSLSRLVRWYLPVFIVLGLGVAKAGWRPWTRRASAFTGTGLLLASFLAVFAVQMLAPFPYEDYQVPIMGLLATCAAVVMVKGARQETGDADVTRVSRLASHALASRVSLLVPLLALGLAWASSFGSPLLEKWTTNGQDRFWTLKKPQTELAQLRDAARRIEAIDPDGRELLTQDLYLAIETNRKVPKGLEMGPFSILTDAAWRKLLDSAPCAVAAFSGYGFAVNPPVCDERPLKDQLAYWEILKSRYELAFREDAFGQNATTLLVLKRK